MWDNSSSFSQTNAPTCAESSTVLALSLAFSTVQALLILPLSIYVLTLGYQRWHLQSPFTNTDLFAYNLSAMHLLFIIGDVLFFVGWVSDHAKLQRGADYLRCVIYPGELLIQSLTCVDRYLAVIHPVIYIKFKQSIGVYIRHVSIAITWLACFGYIGLKHLSYPNYPYILYNCFFVPSLVVISYCCGSVLRALIRPKPGDVKRVDQSKRRAFHMMAAITSVLLLWFVVVLLNSILEQIVLEQFGRCVIFHALVWLHIPSSVVLGALLLHREGKFTIRRK